MVSVVGPLDGFFDGFFAVGSSVIGVDDGTIVGFIDGSCVGN